MPGGDFWTVRSSGSVCRSEVVVLLQFFMAMKDLSLTKGHIYGECLLPSPLSAPVIAPSEQKRGGKKWDKCILETQCGKSGYCLCNYSHSRFQKK